MQTSCGALEPTTRKRAGRSLRLRKLWPLRLAALPGGAVAGAEEVFALVLEEDELALGDHDELVLGAVPVAERGAGAGLRG